MEQKKAPKSERYEWTEDIRRAMPYKVMNFCMENCLIVAVYILQMSCVSIEIKAAHTQLLTPYQENDVHVFVIFFVYEGKIFKIMASHL
jgi:hypothetical protein